MSNVFKVIDMIATQGLAIAHEKSTFTSTVNRQFDDSFGQAGNKIGSTLRVMEPNEYTVRTGRVVDLQDQNESTQTVTLATQVGVDMGFTSAELALNTDDASAVGRFSKRYLEPAIARLTSKIDGDCLTLATQGTYNCVGTAGTAATILNLAQARAKLNQGLAPKDSNRSLQIDSIAMSEIVNANKGLFLPGGQVNTAFAEGFYGRSQMADFYENERTWTMTNGSDVLGTTDVAAGVTDGGTTLSADTASPVTYTVGQVFTIAGVYSCHPETKQSLGFLQQYTNTAGTGSGGDMTISPATVLSGAKQNVCKADGTALATTDFNSQTLTCVGAASTAYRQSLMYHKDAFAYVMADLPEMDGQMCKTKRYEDMSLRVWMAPDIRNDQLICRIDALYGFRTFRPAWACRVTS